MESGNKYQLTISFDQNQTDIGELWNVARKTLDKDVVTHVGLSESNELVLTIEGHLESVDKSHLQITRYLIEKRELPFFRIKDTASDEIRNRAYPILSAIEQELRSFINHCLIDAFGFSWWASLGEIDLPGKKGTVIKNDQHPLEQMTIEELIGFITFEKAEWEEQKPVVLNDLVVILNKSQSFEDFRMNLSRKIRKVSLWEDVFSKYLTVSQDDWGQLKNKDLEFIIDVRNRVMHHRPVHLGELSALDDKRKKINEIITSAKFHLSNQEKEEINNRTKEIRDVYSEMVFEYSEKNVYSKVFDGLRKANNLSLIQKISKEITSYHLNNKLSEKEYLELRAISFDQMRALLENDFNQTHEIIINELLPFCLQENSDLRMQYRSFREILVEWIEQHSQENKVNLRNQVLSTLIPLIGSDKHNPVCWTISDIGYKRQDLVEKLWDFAKGSDDEIGDVALSTLTWLGLSKNENRYVLEELNKRSKARFNTYLLFAIARINDPKSIEVILQNWLSPESRESKKVDASLAFTAIREILAACDNDVPTQEKVWNQVSEIIEKDPKSLYWEFDIGHITQECNSINIIPKLLSWFGEHPEWFDKPDWSRYLVEERFASLIKPRQLEGWKNINRELIHDLLIHDAQLNTKNDLFVSTQESLVKENAWKTILRAGYDEALNWFDQAIVGEDGRFIRQEIMEYFSCFRFEPLPKEVIQWIIEKFDDSDSGDSRELAYRMAAVSMARSSATEEAFTALLSPGFTYKGKVLTQSTNALAEVTIDMLRHGKNYVVDQLAKIIIGSRIERERFVSTFALETVASFPEFQALILPYVHELIPVLFDENRASIERGYILLVLAQLVEWQIPDDLLSDLFKWAHLPDEWLGRGSLQVLATHGYLEQNEALLKELLGIEKEGSKLRLISSEKHLDWFQYIVGILYNRNSEAFSPIIASILLDPEWQSVAQILSWLKVTHKNKPDKKIDSSITDALYQRTSRFSPFSIEVNLFDAILMLDPQTLLYFPNPDSIRQWMPEGRVAFANSLEKIVANPDQQRQALSILEILTDDSFYPVRRAAYRAISHHDSVYLYSLCRTWAESSIIDLNRRSAEACGWIAGIKTNEGKDGFDDIYPLLISHQDRQVRESAEQSYNERKRRIWSRDYLNRVIGLKETDNHEILQTWCYGDALSLIGDDECRDILINYLSEKPLPPNVRYWIKSILKKVDENWKKVTQKWPDPWTEMKGLIKRGKGKFDNKHDPLVEIQYTIWYDTATIPTAKHSWGGIMIIPSLAEFIDVQSAEIMIENDSVGKILITGLQGNSVSFQGTGKYPFI